tara:strand:+ start:930 stop:1268 length:339 start_codon:yes stop_codon:yes gene_type:complete
MKSYKNINHWLRWAGMLPYKNIHGIMVEAIDPKVISTLIDLLGESPIQVHECDYDPEDEVPNKNYQSTCIVDHSCFGWCEISTHVDSPPHTYYKVLLGGGEVPNPYEVIIKA